MPNYDYKCPRCGSAFEVFQRISARPGAPCPKCGAAAERQLSGGHGLLFKGSGFYETDYKRAGEKQGDKGTDAKPGGGSSTPGPSGSGAKE